MEEGAAPSPPGSLGRSLAFAPGGRRGRGGGAQTTFEAALFLYPPPLFSSAPQPSQRRKDRSQEKRGGEREAPRCLLSQLLRPPPSIVQLDVLSVRSSWLRSAPRLHHLFLAFPFAGSLSSPIHARRLRLLPPRHTSFAAGKCGTSGAEKVCCGFVYIALFHLKPTIELQQSRLGGGAEWPRPHPSLDGRPRLHRSRRPSDASRARARQRERARMMPPPPPADRRPLLGLF